MSDYTYAGGTKAKPTKANQAKRKARGGALGGGFQSYNKTTDSSTNDAKTARAAAGNNGFIANAKVSTKPVSNLPDYLKQTPAAAASQAAQAAQDAESNSVASKLLAQIMSSSSSPASGTKSFSGNLANYLAQANKEIKGTSYASAVAAAKKNAASGQKDIGSMYSALAAYTAGQKPVVAQEYADSANDLTSSSQTAANLANSMYSSLQGNMAQGAGSVAAGAKGTAAVGQDAALDQNASHKDAVAGALAQGLQSALINNTSQKGAALGWINNSGNAAQLGGAQAKTDLTKSLQRQLAEYATLQSQADAQKSAQALQLAQGQFDSDRSYALSQQQAAQAAADAQFSQLLQKYQIAQSADPNSVANQQALAKLQASQNNTDTANAIKVQANQTSFINSWIRQFGAAPTKQDLANAGF